MRHEVDISYALDIETLEKPIPVDTMAEVEAEAKKYCEKRFVKEDVIAKNIKQRVDAFRNKWKFTRHGTQILCVGIVQFKPLENEILDRFCHPSDDEAEAVKASVDFLNTNGAFFTRSSKLFTYNGSSFDIPIWAAAIGRHGAELNQVLNRYTHQDLCRYPFEKDTSGKESLDSLCGIYGIESEPPFELECGSPLDGSQVAKMWEMDKQDDGSRVKQYCLWDCEKLSQLVARLSRVWDFS